MYVSGSPVNEFIEDIKLGMQFLSCGEYISSALQNNAELFSKAIIPIYSWMNIG